MQNILSALRKEGEIAKTATWKTIEFSRALETEKCPSGYKGRKGIQEVLMVDPAIKEMILHGNSTDEIEEHAKKQGMLTMLEDGLFKAVQGKTSIEEVLRVISE